LEEYKQADKDWDMVYTKDGEETWECGLQEFSCRRNPWFHIEDSFELQGKGSRCFAWLLANDLALCPNDRGEE